MFGLVFYLLMPLPLAFCPMLSGGGDAVNTWSGFQDFLMTFLAVSVFALPCALLHVGSIDTVLFFFTLGSDVVAFGTVGLFAYLKLRAENYGY